MRVAVIGSGPSGMACVKALIRRGLKPTLIDAGETLPADRQTAVDRMAATSPRNWNRADLELVTENPTIKNTPFPKRRVFGSNYVFARERAFAPLEARPDTPAPTFAKGGFSVVWGAAMLPADRSDLHDWPTGSTELEPSYARVLADIPLSARHDSLETAFPLFKQHVAEHEMSESSKATLHDLQRVASVAEPAPFLCGQARLALDRSHCRNCGLCLSGCVYGAIYSTKPEIDLLSRKGEIEYQPATIVQRFCEDATGVDLELHDTAASSGRVQRFDRIFLAAGVIESTRIVLRSLEIFNQPTMMKDVQKFVLPLLRPKQLALAWPNSATLAAIFLEFKVPDISNDWIHVQISDIHDLALRSFGLSPWRLGLRARLLAPLYERMMIAWFGLHSDFSSRVMLKLSSRTRDGIPILEMQNVLNPATGAITRRTARYFARRVARAGFWAVTPALMQAPPGGGEHFGGTMPMRSHPKQRLETDIFGRLYGHNRIHIVDGSIMPSIPATTIALLQMANADRIVMALDWS